ncbi:MAG TPA: NAD(P)-dependent oxidoreductase [Ramlibacter sp.]|nr:NAD(P)-dependent oxidoreductase [Ramlibacter sp.]
MSDAVLNPGCKIGFIGLGNMGRPMAARLAAAGYALHLVDARPEVAREVAAETGGVALDSVAQLAPGLDALVLMLPDGQAVRHVLDAAGVMQRLARGSVVIDMGSCEPGGTVQLGKQLAAAGIGMVDAPVSGGVPRARTGELTIMAGGDAQAVERCRPLLSAMGNRIFATGALGSGQAMKSLNNFVSAVGLVAACEAVVIGRGFGLDPQVIAEVLNGSTGKNNTTEHKLRQFILSGSFASGFALDLMVKDLAIAASVAQHTHTPTVLADKVLSLWREAQASLGPGHDHTEMARWLETVMRTESNDTGGKHEPQ